LNYAADAAHEFVDSQQHICVYIIGAGFDIDFSGNASILYRMSAETDDMTANMKTRKCGVINI